MGVCRDEPRVEQRAEVRAAVGGEHRRRAPPALAFGVAASKVDAARMDERAERAAVQEAQRADDIAGGERRARGRHTSSGSEAGRTSSPKIDCGTTVYLPRCAIARGA